VTAIAIIIENKAVRKF